MKILPDECVDQELRHPYADHDCQSAAYAKLAGLKNGVLLDPSGVNAEHAGKLRNILVTLHTAPTIDQMDLPSFGLQSFKGRMGGYWVVTVRANWRVTFRFEDGVAEDVDYVDYH